MTRISQAAFAAALLAPAAAFAQAGPGAADPCGTGPLDQVVVTATRADQGVAREDLGASVTVLTAEDLQARQTVVVSDVLRDSPGVEVSRTGGVGGLTAVRLRGAESNHTLVLIDGIKASDPYQGAFDFAGLIADDVARVEVLRGEQSALWGSDAIGGVIDYITATGAEAPGIRGHVEGGSFGTGAGAARVAGVSGGTDYALSGSLLHTDGFPVAPGGTRDVGADIGALAAKIDVTLAPNLRLKAIGRYSAIRADTDGQDYLVTGNAVDGDAFYRNRAVYGLLGLDADFLDGRWRNSLSVQGADALRRNYEDGALSFGDKGRRLRGSYVATFAFGADRVRQTLTAAVDAEHDGFQTIDPTGFADTSLRHINTLGLVAQYDVVFDSRLALGGAVRHDANSKFQDDDTFHLQASYHFPGGTRAHAAAGSGVQDPGVFQLYGYSPGDNFVGNPNLKPEKSTGWEAGLEQALLGGRALLNATWFDSVLKDEIATDYAVTPNSVENLATHSTRRGVEVSGQVRPGGGVTLDLAYTWLDARQDGVEEQRRARDIASLNLGWRASDDRFGANIAVRYNGDQTDTNFATFQVVTLPAYTLVDLGADVRLSKTIQLYGRIENLFDERYMEQVGFREAGRGAYAGIRAGF